jgi:predicted small metal-binding protein
MRRGYDRNTQSDSLREGKKIPKVLRCQDMGVSCSWQARGQTVEEVMQKAAVHARDAHGMRQMTPEMAAKAKSLIKDVK